MYKIGEFSKISKCSVQTLRYYDKLNILKPKIIGKYNNYRYYSEDDLIELNVVKKLKQMGYKLSEIPHNLSELSDELFLEKKLELENEISFKKQTIKNLELIIYSSQVSNEKIIETLKTSSKNNKENKKMKRNYKEFKEKLLKAYDKAKDGDKRSCILLLEEIKNDLFLVTKESDPFWIISAGNLFAGVVYEIIENCPREEVTFTNITYSKVNDKNIIENIDEYIKTLKMNSYSYLTLFPFSDMAPNTFKGLKMVFHNALTDLTIQEIL
jgi:DNA-binding transcriptional MerR regulator